MTKGQKQNVKLYHGDCFKIFPKILNKSVQLILTDLPYGITNCEWDKVLDLSSLWKEYERVLKENGAVVLTANHPFTTKLINSNPKWFRYELIWYKTKASGFLLAKKMPIKSHENILVFYKRSPIFNPQKYTIDPKFQKKGKSNMKQYSNVFNLSGPKHVEYQYLDIGERFADSVLCFPSEMAKGMHPTQKPLRLMRFLIKSFSNPGDLVLDNCMGSGTTGVACIETERGFIGVEKEKKFYELAKKRIQKAKEIKRGELP
ncbi:DNA-methyltransferase [Leptospira alexanderi]|uniref:Methyltransferase n=1 Tax=Leptospira alexanderi serovar Manhao 3 str. L 60 TaxID=1049759 RepID=V6HUK1_9LEPT|nr:site-specific DNA-methyltransferase [Leptospira alexanderi]EQA61405.1 DNA methylase family protein [Leptospira alexanderi serovar Manhao 3 str. L 60]